jgi:hypothetical protein
MNPSSGFVSKFIELVILPQGRIFSSLHFPRFSYQHSRRGRKKVGRGYWARVLGPIKNPFIFGLLSPKLVILSKLLNFSYKI